MVRGPSRDVRIACGIDGESRSPVAGPPPKNVAYARLDPSALSLRRNASLLPPYVPWSAPAVVGKSLELVTPARNALPAASTTSPNGSSPPNPEDPPTNVEYTRTCAALIFATNIRYISLSGKDRLNAPPVMGKSFAHVDPATYTFPSRSTATRRGLSDPQRPPRNVEKTSGSVTACGASGLACPTWSGALVARIMAVRARPRRIAPFGFTVIPPVAETARPLIRGRAIELDVGTTQKNDDRLRFSPQASRRTCPP